MVNKTSPANPSRRKFIKTGLVAAGTVAAGLVGYSLSSEPTYAEDLKKGQIQAYEDTIRGMLSKGALPIIDVHLHWGGNMAIGDFIATMNRNDVALAWPSPINETYWPDISSKLSGQYPDRIVPTTVGVSDLFHKGDNRSQYSFAIPPKAC